jgi:CheY-like chemotaxis protein
VAAGGAILIVDDDPDIREALRDHLELLGYEVVVAADGVEALRCLKYGPAPAAMLLDLNMPRLDGEAFASHVRETAGHAEVPIVAMSASSRRLPPRLATAHLDKPFDLDALDALLGRYCTSFDAG